MMSVGLHCRLSRPARVAAIQEFIDYAKSYGNAVWICTREQIANHFYEKHLPRGVGTPIDSSIYRASSSASSSPFGGASSSSGGGYSGSSGGYAGSTTAASHPGTSSPANRFSFLGNLTVPRDASNAHNIPSASNEISDGDII